MIHTGQIDRAWEQGPVTIRPLRSLRQADFDAVSTAIAGGLGSWTIEQHDDYDGYLSILVSPERDTDAPTFLISGQIAHIELAEFQGDELRTLGRFETVEATIAELAKVLRLSGPT